MRGGVSASEQTAVAVRPLRLPSKALATMVTPRRKQTHGLAENVVFGRHRRLRFASDLGRRK